MAVTHNKKSRTIRGKTYAYGESFICYEANKGNASSDGSGDSAAALTKGTTYTFKGYATDDNTGNLTAYPYLIGDSSGKTRGWYKEDVFPYAATYTISYNANGGSGAPASQTKWHGVDLTISSTKPTRTGYTFKGWALSKAEADAGTWYYQPGATCGANKDLTLYAVWTSQSYTISYNANGGTGAPASQTKQHGVDLIISSAKPTRTGYTFKGWASSATSATVVYNPGDKYIANVSFTLYAVWVVANKPTITNFSVYRCNDQSVADDEGQYVFIAFDWSSETEATKIDIEAKSQAESTWLIASVPASGTSGSCGYRITYGGGPFDLETTYQIRVIVTDANGSTPATQTVGESAYPLEFIADNKGVHFGKAVQGNAVGLSDLIILPNSTNFDDITKPGGFSVPSNAAAATMTNIPVKQAGRLFIANSVGYDDPESEWEYIIQTFIPYLVSEQIYERHIRKNDTSTWIYSPWVVTLRNRHSMVSAWNTSNITKTATGETQIPLTDSTIVGDGLTIENNAIVIGQYITAVEVSAAGMISCASKANASAKNLYIRKNGTDVAISMNSSWEHPVNSSGVAQSINFQLNVSPKLIEVKEGDRITFHWYASYNATNGGDVLQGVAARTYITVKEF